MFVCVVGASARTVVSLLPFPPDVMTQTANDPAVRRRRAVLAQDLRAKIFALLEAVDYDASGVSTGHGIGGSGGGDDAKDTESKTSAAAAGGGGGGAGGDVSVEERIFLRGLCAVSYTHLTLPTKRIV